MQYETKRWGQHQDVPVLFNISPERYESHIITDFGQVALALTTNPEVLRSAVDRFFPFVGSMRWKQMLSFYT